uniref:Reverse transcriptase domain-containing protein n=1 Tax=Tanacetum cinerariifolium TaxID=118510 RepID=A0A6L2NZ99_TANCI|nr:reverse transcriptase domain-containing protein [Tanacetum cinerariifolium]
MAELLRAPTEGTTNLRNEISNFQQRFDETFHEAWDRYKYLLRAFPHHGFTEFHQLDTFYNALNPADQDSLNVVAGGNLLERPSIEERPGEACCYSGIIDSDQDSLNVVAGGNLLERRTQDVLTIIKNKSKVRNSRNKLVVSQVKSCNANSNSSSEIAKLTHAVNQQTSAITTTMTAILKQFQATPPLASVKSVEEICVTYGGAHPYYQCLTAGWNTFPELQDNIQGYVSAAAVNYNQGNSVYLPPEKVKRMNEANIKPMQTQINMVKNELRNEMKNSIQASLSNQSNEIKNMMASLLQMNTASTSGSGSLPSNTVANPKGDLKDITTRSGHILDGPTVPTPPPFINPEEDEHVEETLRDSDLSKYTIKVPPPPKLPEKLRDPGKFLIPCGFSELKCKDLANLGASINLMPFSVWKKLGLPELISTRITLELANRTICTPAGIARYVFVPVGKFTFPADFVIVNYESGPRVPLILGRPFLWTARALIDVHGKEMILYDGDERSTLNMRHDTSSYSNQPRKESINLINVFNNSSEDFLEDLFSNQPSGNPTFSSHPELTSEKVNDDIFDLEGGNVLLEKLLDLDSTKDLYPPLHINLLSGSTTYFFLLTHCDIDSSLKDLINQNNLANLADIFVDSIPKMFTDEHALDYSSPPIFNEYDGDFLEVESDTKKFYDDPFDYKGEKIKESKLLIGELDLPYDFPLSEYVLFISQDFSRVDAKPSTNNEDKVFNPGILSQEKPFKIITHAIQDKKLATSNASLMLEDFDPPFYEPLFFKEVPRSRMLLLFSSENEEKVFKPGIHTSEKVHSSCIPELSHQGYKVFKINQIFKSPMEIFLFSCRKDTHILVVPYLHFYPLDQFKCGGISILVNLKTHAEGFCPPVFISSASLGNHVSKSNHANIYLMAYHINGLRFT